MKLEEKLGVNKYYVNEGHPHIEIIHDYPDMAEKIKLVNACPAGLYTLQDDGTLAFDYAGCVECGTCRVLCGNTIIKKWEYPDDTKGIEFRQG